MDLSHLPLRYPAHLVTLGSANLSGNRRTIQESLGGNSFQGNAHNVFPTFVSWAQKALIHFLQHSTLRAETIEGVLSAAYPLKIREGELCRERLHLPNCVSVAG